MPVEMMNTREVAAYLGIHEKQVYALVRKGHIPCTRVTGRWIFPRRLIDMWIYANAVEGVSDERIKSTLSQGELRAAGSNDPVLDILLAMTRKIHEDFRVFSLTTGSSEGLRLLGERRVDIAWCHLFDPQSGEYTIPYVMRLLPGMQLAVVHLFRRELGLLSSPGLDPPVGEFADLTRAGVSFINRQKGSGTRVLLDHRLEAKGVSTASINGYEREVLTHIEVGLSILSGESNAGFATVAVARLFGLHFVPIVLESFDMVITKDVFFRQEVQDFIETLQSPDFRARVAPLGAYDFTDAGRILHSST